MKHYKTLLAEKRAKERAIRAANDVHFAKLMREAQNKKRTEPTEDE